MDMSTIAGAALLMKSSQTRQAIGMTLMKQAAEQQTAVVAMLQQNAQAASLASADSGYGFSTYA